MVMYMNKHTKCALIWYNIFKHKKVEFHLTGMSAAPLCGRPPIVIQYCLYAAIRCLEEYTKFIAVQKSSMYGDNLFKLDFTIRLII